MVYHQGDGSAKRMDFSLSLESPFNLEYTLESGQVFRWERRGDWWYGVVGDGVLKLRQEADSLICSSSRAHLDGAFVRSYFRLDEDLERVLVSIMKDANMTKAVQEFHGLRLVRQGQWECLASFLLATNSNIPRIKQMVSNICSAFGTEVEFEDSLFRLFPPPSVLAEAKTSELERCGLGYRAPFLKRVAASVEEGRLDFSELTLVGYEQARRLLLSRLLGEKLLLGVGPKVADCVLLFSCDKDEAFPIDVWIARALSRLYPSLVEPKLRKKIGSSRGVGLTLKEYERLSATARKYFGRYAGYAQQYLFMMARQNEAA